MRRSPARLATIGAIGTLTAGLLASGCFTSGTDFVDDAEQYIIENESLRSQLLPDDGTRFTEATCADPRSSTVGTTFSCAAVDSTGDAWEFEIEITGRAGYRVHVSRYPAD